MYDLLGSLVVAARSAPLPSALAGSRLPGGIKVTHSNGPLLWGLSIPQHQHHLRADGPDTMWVLIAPSVVKHIQKCTYAYTQNVRSIFFHIKLTSYT